MFKRMIFRDASFLDVLMGLFVVTLLVILFFAYSSTPYRIHLLVIYPGSFFAIWLVGRIRSSSRFSEWENFIRLLYPILFLFGIFETFFMVLPFLSASRFDSLFIRIDLAIFGVHPTVWIERWIIPWFTEVMYYCYILYFPMPLIPVIYLYRVRDWYKLEWAMFVLMLCYFGGYIGYFLFPASGPRFNLHELQTLPLEGLWLTNSIRDLIDILEPNKLDAFPSLHAAILLTTMQITYSVHRRIFYGFIPLAIGITISLIYCRYHYAIDVLVGFGWSVLSVWFANRLFDKNRKKFISHFREKSTE